IHGDITRISGDAELALAKIDRSMIISDLTKIEASDVIIDAILGAGLDRDVTGPLAEVIGLINDSGKPVISVDLPSGIDGRTGRMMGIAVKANHTVTFFRYKPGHMLFPGRKHCGMRSLHQIGIDADVTAHTGITGNRNDPEIWLAQYPTPSLEAHKYDRGHTLVLSGPPTATGAARLLAGAALRAGSGLVTIASPTDALSINAAHLTSVMLQKADNPKDVKHILKDKRFNCVALGPGMPPGKQTIAMVKQVLEQQRKTVLDAGALTAFAGKPETLFKQILSNNRDTFLTPHEGEFARLFPTETTLTSKIERAVSAAERSGAIVILKGPDTIVACPTGQVSISDNAPPWLATAGSGDVLAGIIAGLASQGMPGFEAASAGVWLHGDAANRLGPGMISSDLDQGLHQSIKALVA
ncbi:MAG: NAD(P)H-hydrate dehydratase, partial [Pseudomonadota bacterium]